jgi:cytochrome c oxidase subunit 2
MNHGFSLYPINVNFQVVPGYDYGLRVTPNASGDFRIICNEFCGIGHHVMVGRVIVDDEAVARAGADPAPSPQSPAATGGPR